MNNNYNFQIVRRWIHFIYALPRIDTSFWVKMGREIEFKWPDYLNGNSEYIYYDDWNFAGAIDCQSILWYYFELKWILLPAKLDVNELVENHHNEFKH